LRFARSALWPLVCSLMLASAWALGCCQSPGSRWQSDACGERRARLEAARYFALLSGYWSEAEEKDVDTLYDDAEKVDQLFACAVEELTRTKEGDAWLINLILGGGEPPSILGGERLPWAPPGINSIGWEIVSRLPSSASPQVLWAVTCCLNYKGRRQASGTYKDSSGETVHWDGWTEPLRDTARKALVRALGVDFEYDVQEWRHEILRRARGTARGADVRAGS
jgi:hypothetical protein